MLRERGRKKGLMAALAGWFVIWLVVGVGGGMLISTSCKQLKKEPPPPPEETDNEPAPSAETTTSPAPGPTAAATAEPPPLTDQETVEKTVREYYDAINRQDLETAKKFWTREDIGAYKIQLTIKAYEKLVLITVGVSSPQKNRAKAEVTVSCVRKDGKAEEICRVLFLTRVKDAWKIESTGNCPKKTGAKTK